MSGPVDCQIKSERGRGEGKKQRVKGREREQRAKERALHRVIKGKRTIQFDRGHLGEGQPQDGL